MELARDIPSAAMGAAPLLRRGVRLSPSLATRLSSLGIRALWIEDDMGEGIIPAMPLPDHIRAATEEAVAACFEAARAVAADLSELPFNTLKQIEHAADSLIDALADAPEAALAFDDLASADSYTYNHSMRVATLGLLVRPADRPGTVGWVDYRGEVRHDRMVERMTQLTMGLLVHDIGKLAIPEQILNKPGKLSPEEWELVKTHPAACASLLDSDRISPLTRSSCATTTSAGTARGIPQAARAATSTSSPGSPRSPTCMTRSPRTVPISPPTRRTSRSRPSARGAGLLVDPNIVVLLPAHCYARTGRRTR